ncbi:hypothetical protein HRbin35_00296 [bacterium HR35]|nr:hypothetical protein HRbin35_00296 [bacterium HR35]
MIKKFFDLTLKIVIFLLLIALLPKDFLLDLKTKIDSLGLIKILKTGLANFFNFVKNYNLFNLNQFLALIYNYLKNLLK